MMSADLKKNLHALLELQREYIQLVEEESPDHEEAIGYYVELVDELKKQIRNNAMKFARQMVVNRDFLEGITVTNASLYVPLLGLLQMVFRGHKFLAALLLKEHSEHLAEIVQEVVHHLDQASETLVYEAERGRRRRPSSRRRDDHHHDDGNHLYSYDEATLVSDLSAKFMRSVVDSAHEVTAYILIQCPDTTACFSRCSTLLNSREFSKLAMLLIEEEERLREIELRTAAAVVIQAAWKGVLTSRKWHLMKHGFVLLQRLYRQRLQGKEVGLRSQLCQSERAFEVKLEALSERRMQQEKIYESIRQTPPGQLVQLFTKEKEAAASKIQEFWRTQRESIAADIKSDDDLKPSAKEESAALVIQAAIRRWLIRKRNEHLVRSRAYLHHCLTEDKVIKLQQDIDAWQHHNKVPPMSSNEFAELHHKGQMRYARFCQSLPRSRKQEQKTSAALAQTQAIISLLESAPDLKSYEPNRWADFHSLPLYVATKARLDHNAAMKSLELPSWKRILEEFG